MTSGGNFPLQSYVMIVNMRCIGLLLCFALLLPAQLQMNLQQLADFVRSELALRRHSDKQIAAAIKKLTLTERLTDKAIIDLQAQGAGPKTVEALQALRDETASIKSPTHDVTSSPATAPDQGIPAGSPTATLSVKAPPIPPPDSIRQSQIRDAMTHYAMNYTANLPNFVCVQVTRQYVDPNGGTDYRSIGTILARVSYNEGQEQYKVYSQYGHLVDTDMQSLRAGGATSTGEFGSLMREIFEPKSDAEFGWDHWGTLRGRRMAVFNYFIDSGHSNWSITYDGNSSEGQRIITAYRGLIYADPQTGEIARIKFVAVGIPKEFPVQEASEILDYDLTEIGSQKYVCPLIAQLWMRAGRESTHNEIEFRAYRKFGTESSITYDMEQAAKPLPPSKTQEQPAAAEPKPAPQPAPTQSSPWVLPKAPPPPPR
jgi:hypothetical protein